MLYFFVKNGEKLPFLSVPPFSQQGLSKGVEAECYGGIVLHMLMSVTARLVFIPLEARMAWMRVPVLLTSLCFYFSDTQTH